MNRLTIALLLPFIAASLLAQDTDSRSSANLTNTVPQLSVDRTELNVNPPLRWMM